MQDNYELSVVIPAYNEEIHIESLIRDWHHVFESNSISYQFIIIDDGSIDNTVQLVKGLKANIPAITVYSQSNKGHGPAFLNGYKIGISSHWVFQIDGDHQLETNAFTELWQKLQQYDLLMGERNEKNESRAGRLVSIVSKHSVFVSYGKGIIDVNSPYRLMRASELQDALLKISSKIFAPNVLLSAYWLFHKKRIYLSKVNNRKNIRFKKIRMNKYFLKGCINSIIQIVKLRFAL